MAQRLSLVVNRYNQPPEFHCENSGMRRYGEIANLMLSPRSKVGRCETASTPNYSFPTAKEQRKQKLKTGQKWTDKGKEAHTNK